ncbi:MAG: orotidine-5'-phosphate decarboxylase [Mesorhizobium sp.]|uniref:orotidine-5'-phosphate decarboxylase n=1 Tax=Mesorhizobium sp. TaxID=1871066 RepID=UPI0011FC5722|nr:orotidine-5'-phosphate decarboxylase [Mesorhizobium sp.]TIR48035.1 MAG: orotidine-5'-phosphate decarboxylase [Mesorhizobium sp.]
MPQISWCERVETNVGKFGNVVAGIDPHLPDVPAAFDQDPNWISRYVDFVLATIEGQVGFVKFQSAYFEAWGLAGMAALASGIKKAKAAGMGVILDAKRGDIGPTATAYARAYLTPAAAGGNADFEVDCITVNPLMGPDTLQPFVACAKQFGKGLFVLCRTSNPGAGWLQDRIVDNHVVSDLLADLIASLAEECRHRSLSPIGAVVGATVPEEGRRLRRMLPYSIILAPGLGPQGGDPTTIHALRGHSQADLLVPVSRGLTRTEDRSMSLKLYSQLLLTRIAGFKSLVDCRERQSSTQS